VKGQVALKPKPHTHANKGAAGRHAAMAKNLSRPRSERGRFRAGRTEGLQKKLPRAGHSGKKT